MLGEQEAELGERICLGLVGFKGAGTEGGGLVLVAEGLSFSAADRDSAEEEREVHGRKERQRARLERFTLSCACS